MMKRKHLSMRNTSTTGSSRPVCARTSTSSPPTSHSGLYALRHAVRVTVVCALDVALILLLHIDHGYWLLLTSLIVLQPHVSGTLRRGLERVGGTIGGGILAALLAVVLHSQLVIAAVLFPLSMLALAVLPVSYAAFAFFLTPAFVLAWLPYSGDWQLALIRVFNTFAGAVIAILAMMFLFPIYERERAPAFLRASLTADRRYLEQLAEAWKIDSPAPRQLAERPAPRRPRAQRLGRIAPADARRVMATTPALRPFRNRIRHLSAALCAKHHYAHHAAGRVGVEAICFSSTQT